VPEIKRDKFKYEIENIIKDLFTLLQEKDRLEGSNDPKKISKKYQNEKKIEDQMNSLYSSINSYRQEIEAYKRKKKNVYLNLLLIN
jgi:hypothetical protein